MEFSAIEKIFWLSGLGGHLTLVALLVRRSHWRTFPVFTMAMAYEGAVSIALLCVSRFGTPHAYFVWYWAFALADYLFQVLLLVELTFNILPRRVWSWHNSLIWLSIGGALLAAFLCKLLRPPEVSGLDLLDEKVTLFTSLMTCELYVAIAFVANRLRVRWSGHTMAVGQGLALWAAVAVLGDVLHALCGWKTRPVMWDRLRMVTYLFDIVYWGWAFSRSWERPRGALEDIERVFSPYLDHVRSNRRMRGSV